jgi:hypothetical protein
MLPIASRHVKVPFFLQPPAYYRGPAWYQRDILIPPNWRGRRITLSLERPHWETQVWIDDAPLGRCDSLYTPHDYALENIGPGKHRLTIRVDNRLVIDIGADGHGSPTILSSERDWRATAGAASQLDRGFASLSRCRCLQRGSPEAEAQY